MNEAKNISTITIVQCAEEIIVAAMKDKNLDIEKRAKIVGNMLNTQLKAGALNLGYQRAISRLPEGSESRIPQLSGPSDKSDPTK